MRNRQLALVAAVLTLSAGSWAATNFANAPQGAHYRNGFGEPVCSINGLTVSCTGTQIAGVGNLDADVVLSVSYGATVNCTNHGGKLVPVKTQVTTASSRDEDTEPRNGTLYVAAVSQSAPPSTQTFLDAASCPNGNWTKSMPQGSPTVTGFTYTLTFDGFNSPVILITYSAA